METFLARFIRLLALLMPATALIYNSSAFFGEVADRTLVFWAITEIMVLAWGWLCILNSKYRPYLNVITIAASLWVLSITLSSVFGHNSYLSFYSTFERMTGLLTFLHLCCFFLVLVSTFTRNDWKTLLLSFFVVGIISSLSGLGLRHERNIDGRLIGTLGNPSFFAAYLLFQITVTGIFAHRLWSGRFRKWAYVLIPAVLLLHVSALLLTGSRSGLIALIGGCTAFLLFTAFRHHRFRYWTAGTLTALPIAYWSLAYILKNNPLPKEWGHLHRLFDISLSADTFLVRINLWKVAWNAFQKYPLLGWGFEGFPAAFLQFYNPALYQDGLWYDNPHNLFFEWMINGGLFGLTGFLTCFVLCFYKIAASRHLTWLVKSIILSYGISYLLFNFNNFDSINTLIPLFTLFAFAGYEEKAAKITESKKIKKPGNIAFTAVALIIVFTGTAMYFFVIKSYQTNRDIYRAGNSVNLLQSVENYSNGYQNALVGKYDVLIQFGLVRNRIPPDIDPNLLKNYYINAQDLLGKGLVRFPGSGQLLNQLGHLNVKAGQFDKAIGYFEQLREIAPQRQSNLMDLAICYLEAGKTDEAIRLFGYIYNLNKDFDLPLVYQSYAYVVAGDPEKARSVVARIQDATLAAHGQLLYLAYNADEMRNTFCDLYARICEGTHVQQITQQTYWTWIDAAFDSGDTIRLRTAFNCYRYSFNIPEKEIMPILGEAIAHRIRPVAVRRFYRTIPGR